MQPDAHRTWFLTWTTYATWLPGDRRGFVGSVREQTSNFKITRNEPGIPYEAANADLESSARNQLRGSPVWLVPEQAIVVADQLEFTCSHRGWRLLAQAVMPNHVHVILSAPCKTGPEGLMRDLKAYSSRALNERFGKPGNMVDEVCLEEVLSRRESNSGSISLRA